MLDYQLSTIYHNFSLFHAPDSKWNSTTADNMNRNGWCNRILIPLKTKRVAHSDFVWGFPAVKWGKLWISTLLITHSRQSIKFVDFILIKPFEN